ALLSQYDVETKALLLETNRMATLMREHFLLKPLNTFARISLALFIASMIGTGVTLLLMRLFIRRPLRDLAKGMEEVAKGKWGKVVEVGARDELGEVVQSFNYLSVELEKAVKSIEKEKLELEEANEKLQESCYRDILTGLYNYYYFKETLETEYLLASRHATPLSLLMLDVDHFKHINDTFSHPFGNFVLQEMGKRIKESLRRTDIAHRYGGEEFAILLPQTNYEGAKEAAQRIKDNLCGRAYQNDTGLCNVAVTIGISSLEEPEVKESADLIRLADEALLEGKSRGGNCVILASQVCRRPELDVSVLEDYQRRLATSEKNLKRAYMDNTKALLKALEGKDSYSAVHTCLVASYVWHFTGVLELPSAEREVIKNAALLYDLGKIGIPDAILAKKGTLTSEEFDLVRQHPYYSASIVKGIKFLEQEVPIILHHHERWDGYGYPDGLKGKDIPLGARVLALADAYEALTSHRPYRNARPPEEAFKVLQEESGHQFDPELVEPFIKAMKDFLYTTRRVYISQLDKVVEIAGSRRL
ncbi:MAG: diguanylate cyclase, partial [Candidatus Brocadiales bacterium]